MPLGTTPGVLFARTVGRRPVSSTARREGCWRWDLLSAPPGSSSFWLSVISSSSLCRQATCAAAIRSLTTVLSRAQSRRTRLSPELVCARAPSPFLAVGQGQLSERWRSLPSARSDTLCKCSQSDQPRLCQRRPFRPRYNSAPNQRIRRTTPLLRHN